MSFNSLQFLIYLPIVLLLYWILPQKIRWVLLLIASYYFYMSWNPELIFLIVGTTLVSYGAGLAIQKSQKKGVKRFWMILCLVVCLGVLFLFKYYNFLLESVYAILRLFSMDLSGGTLNLILPIGISFYTFQTLSYVIDVYRGTVPAEKHFGYYALFVSFFPQLVAGPIERPQNLLPQLKAKHKLNAEDMDAGFRFLLSGFLKKVVIADFVAMFVNRVYGQLGESNGLAIFIATLLFYLQIFNDFSGYSDIAMGCARMMGIRLTQNFKRPFMATSFHDFWKRWHISLTRWFMDYVYFPLGGSRKGKPRAYFNMFVVFALSGLWHGANWTFVLWGVLGACFQVLENIVRKPVQAVAGKLHFNLGSDWMLWVRRCILLLVGTFDSFFFRASSLSEVGIIFQRLFTNFADGGLTATLASLGMSSLDLILLVGLIAVMGQLWRITAEPPKDRLPMAEGTSARAAKYMLYLGGVLVIALAWLMILSLGDVSSFVYFQF